eukprot:22776_1
MYDDIIHLAMDQQLLTEVRISNGTGDRHWAKHASVHMHISDNLDAKQLDLEKTKRHRQYYLSVVNPHYRTFEEKKDILRKDLVSRAYDELNLNKTETNKITYTILNDIKESDNQQGFFPITNKKHIKRLDGNLFTIGGYEGNDISLSKYFKNCRISRIHAFFLIIGDYLILCDSWSISGTFTLYRSNKNSKLFSTQPNNRCLMRFYKTETIHLRFGENIHVIINPKGNKFVNCDNGKSKKEILQSWLNTNGFAKYFDLFIAINKDYEDINILCKFDDQQLIDLGINDTIDRNKLLEQFRIYKHENFECIHFPNMIESQHIQMLKTYKRMPLSTQTVINGYIRIIAQSAQNYNIPSQIIYICASFIGNKKLEFVEIIKPEQDELKIKNDYDAPVIKYQLSLLTENTNIVVYGQPIKSLKQILNGYDSLFDINEQIFEEIAQKIYDDLNFDAFPPQVVANDFQQIRMLGRSAFGCVYACKKKDSGTLYAMKQINKKRVWATQSAETIISERNFLSDMDSVFVTTLKYAFMDNEMLYLIIDLMIGGDLQYHLNNDRTFSEQRSQFYAAEILLGLDHIHSKGIIFRDINLKNILLDEKGHCKISDLGLSVRMNNDLGVKGYAGTPGS